MQVIVKGRHTEVPEALKELAVRKVEKVRRLFDHIQTLEIEFSEEHSPRVARKHAVEVTLTTKGHLIRATADGSDPASAVDAVVDKIETQLRKLKGKATRRGERTSDNGRSGRAPGSPGNGLESDEEPAIGGEAAEGDSSGSRVSRVTRVAVKPMTPEEAILQMESLGQDFLLFVNAENQQAGVVYRRRDGSFGLVEPD